MGTAYTTAETAGAGEIGSAREVAKCSPPGLGRAQAKGDATAQEKGVAHQALQVLGLRRWDRKEQAVFVIRAVCLAVDGPLTHLAAQNE